MVIQRLIIKNWKNFLSADIPLGERMFIIGANASGKSNLLDILRFLRDITKQAGGLQFAVGERGGVTKIRSLAARKETNILVEVHLGDNAEPDSIRWRYRLVFKNTGGGIIKNQATIEEEIVWRADNLEPILHRTSQTDGEDTETLAFTHLEQINSNANFREIYHFFRDVQYLHVVPQLIRESDSFNLTSGKEDFFGRNLLERMASTNKNTLQARLKKINEVLRVAVPQLDELTFVRDKSIGTPHLEAKYKHWRPQGAKQQEQQFSDGTLRLIGFLWALLDGTETVLLEEPELYLHAAIVKQIPEFIARMQRSKNRVRQVLLTTHSYDLLNTDTIGGKEVLLLIPTKEGTQVEVAHNLTEVQAMLEAGFTTAEATLGQVAPKQIERMTQLSIFD